VITGKYFSHKLITANQENACGPMEPLNITPQHCRTITYQPIKDKYKKYTSLQAHISGKITK
jgi:hypothetical protein